MRIYFLLEKLLSGVVDISSRKRTADRDYSDDEEDSDYKLSDSSSEDTPQSKYDTEEDDNEDDFSDSLSVKSLTSNVEKLFVEDSTSPKTKSNLMVPSLSGTWTNSLGYQVSSHLFLLPSGTEKNQT